MQDEKNYSKTADVFTGSVQPVKGDNHLHENDIMGIAHDIRRLIQKDYPPVL